MEHDLKIQTQMSFVMVYIRVGRNIEYFFRYYWSSVLEFFSVFNNIEISVLNIFGIQYYWPVLMIFSVIPKSRKSHKILKILIKFRKNLSSKKNSEIFFPIFFWNYFSTSNYQKFSVLNPEIPKNTGNSWKIQKNPWKKS